MPIRIEECHINGVYKITPHVFADFRGTYKKYYEERAYAQFGIQRNFTETSEIVSDKGVLRGIHYQTNDSQSKLVHVIRGSVFDVAVDLRPNSATFGQCEEFYLTSEEEAAIFIPEHFAHGFLVLEDRTIFTYQCSGLYKPEFCGGIKWDDIDLAIRWPLTQDLKVILSEKDQKNLSLAQYRDLYCPGGGK